MKFTAYCRQCGHQHPIDQNPANPDSQVMDWYAKHASHDGVGLINRQIEPRRTKRLLVAGWDRVADFRRWMRDRRINGLVAKLKAYGMPVPLTQLQIAEFLHNANVNIAYAATAASTITLASLATSSTLVAGREGNSISNSSNKYLDYLLAGQVTTGTTPTVSTFIETWIITGLDDTPNWPDVFDGTDSAETVTTRNQLFTYGVPASSSIVTATSDVPYAFHGVSLANLLLGICPRDWTPFVVHSTAVNLNSTAGNLFIKSTGITLTVA